MATDPGDCDRLFAEYVNAGDLEGLMTLYEPGCQLVRRDGSVAAGHNEIRIVMQPAFRTEVVMVKVVGRGHDLALVYSD
jgi:ketosteroid isomerase-like protein